jgi:GNAT superfamily N-acetyltransferase
MSDETAVSIRPCLEGDLPAIAALLSQLHPDEDPLDPSSPSVRRAWKAVLARPDERWLLAAVRDGIPVGTIDCVLVPNLTHGGATYGVVENLVVDRHSRRGGIGSALMAAVIERAHRAGCYKVQLMSHADRTDAHAFYQRAGFTPSARGYRRYLP